MDMERVGYKLVLEDHFEGDTLDLTKWEHRHVGPCNGGFQSPSTAFVRDGKLILRFEYKNGEYGEGWYAGEIKAKRKFLRGYFEIRCKCSDPIPDEKGTYPWSAFWIQADHPYEAAFSKGGPGGAEIDIFESMYKQFYPGVMTHIYCAGKKNSTSKGEIDGCMVGGMFIPDCYTDFHTYACEWTEERYRFFVDGFCYAETAWGDGVSEVEEDLVLSMVHPGNVAYPHDVVHEFVVDYVKVWQK